jgi:uncharacterized membrane protein
MRLLWWVLAICAVVGIFKIVDASVSGHFTERQQLHLLGQLITYGCVLLLPVVVLFNVVREFRASRDWKAWLQFAAVLVLFGGGWAWTGYFGNHGAFIIWPLIVGVVFFALLIAHGLAADKRRKEYAEAMTELPDPPSASGAANPDDFKGWS